MFRGVRNDRIEETNVLLRCVEQLRPLVPKSWTIDVQVEPPGATWVDAIVLLIPPVGRPLRLAVELKHFMRALPPHVVQHMANQFAQADGIPVVFAEYIPPVTRRRLEEAGISGVDTTGWIRIISDDPVILIDRSGAHRAPRVRDETIERFTGPSTSRILRYLVTAPVPLGVREIALQCRVSAGTVAKLLPTLEREGIVRRAPRGPVEAIRRPELVERWAQDYTVIKGNRQVLTLMDPRGIDHALKRLPEANNVLITGVHAGQAILPTSITPVVPGKRLMLYAADPYAVADRLRLRPAERAQANVLLVSPLDRALMEEGWISEALGMRVAPVAQVLVDLKSSSGREADLADQIMEILDENDRFWTEWGRKNEMVNQ